MENYRNTLKRRTQIYGALCGLVPVITLAVGWLTNRALTPLDEHANGFIHGCVSGLVLAWLGYCIYTIVTVQKALKDDALLKKMYIKETDERRLFIQNKVGGSGMRLILFLLVFAGVLACFFNMLVSYTLIAAADGVALVMIGLKLYYRAKY